MNVRPMAREDAVAVARLSTALEYPASADDMVRRLGRLVREPGHAAFVAEDHGSVVGWVHVQAKIGLATDGYAEVRALVVDEAVQRRGAGRALVAACEAWAADAGLGRIRLRSGTHRDGAHLFYQRLGYERKKSSYAFERVLQAAPVPSDESRERSPVVVGEFLASDRPAWEVLARGYKHFYETQIPDADYELAWRRLREGRAQGLGARVEGRLVGIAHFLYHGSTWQDRVCYLQDLFVDPAARGKGAARALIEAVAADARDRGASRYYWQTRESNATARALYDRVARFNGFIRYEYPL